MINILFPYLKTLVLCSILVPSYFRNRRDTKEYTTKSKLDGLCMLVQELNIISSKWYSINIVINIMLSVIPLTLLLCDSTYDSILPIYAVGWLHSLYLWNLRRYKTRNQVLVTKLLKKVPLTRFDRIKLSIIEKTKCK